MARTSVSAVEDVLETTINAIQLQAFIDGANAFVDEHLTNKGVGSSLLTEIEKYLAAHFASARDPQTRSESLGDASVTYQRSGDVTEYLRIAAGLDPTGAVEGQLMDGDPEFVFRAGAGYDGDLNLPRT